MFLLARVWLIVLFVSVSAGFAADNGAPANFVGGTVTKPASTGGVIDLTHEGYLEFKTKKADFRIPYERINAIEYGQQVSRRYAMAVIISPVFLLSKSRKHFVTLSYADDDGRPQAMVLQVDKGHVREVLVGLEAKTGRKIEYQDTEARKAGKG
jgi:hypothetical protein